MKIKFLLNILLGIVSYTLYGQTEAQMPEGWSDGNGGTINTLAELRWLSETVEAWDENWTLTADIDASETYLWNVVAGDSLGFSPIGDRPSDGPRQQISFKGSFDGNGFTISGLNINRVGESYIGLFGYAYSATIKNIRLENCRISGEDNVGSLLGYNFRGGFVDNCHTYGHVSGERNVGGLVGHNLDYSIVSNCSSTCSVFGVLRVGGLIGYNYRHAEVYRNFTSGKVDSENGYNGGLIGINERYSVVKGNYSADTVLGHFNVGGLIGLNIRSEVSENYSSSIVNGYSSVGGLIGENVGPASINNCFSCGEVTSSYGSVGGIVGTNRDRGDVYNCYSNTRTDGNSVAGIIHNNLGSSTVRNCYYDTTSIRVNIGIVVDENNQTTVGLSTNDFSYSENFNNWNFSDIWEIAVIPELDGNNRPYLRWQLYDFQISVVSNIPHAGIIQGESYYNKGDEVLLKVIPKEGYEFIAWTLDSDTVSYSNPFSFIFLSDSSQKYVAHFREAFAFSGGDGTAEHPYQIETLQQLGYLSNVTSLWNKHFILVNDIDAAETDTWNDFNGSPLGFSPIGDRENDGSRQQVEFSGFFNGNGHTISGVFINRSGENNVGLFGCNENATVKQLGLIDSDFSGKDNVGSLVGVNSGEIRNCFSTGSIKGNSYIGGLIGVNEGGIYDKIIDSYSYAEVNGGNFIGGLAGENFAIRISNCYAAGKVTGTHENTGGLLGYNISDSVFHTYFDISTSGTTTGIGGWSDTAGCTGLFTDEFSYQENFENWDFLDNWEIALFEDMDTVKRPYLKWQLHHFSVTFQKEGRGDIIGNPSQTVAYGAEATAVTAQPFEGEQFIGWKDGADNIVSIDNVLVAKNVKSNTTFTAIFTENSIDIATNEEGDFRIFPNPTNTLLNIETGIPDLHKIEITSQKGQLLYSKKMMEGTTHQIDLSSFEKGVYFITIRSKDLVTTRKIIKM